MRAGRWLACCLLLVLMPAGCGDRGGEPSRDGGGIEGGITGRVRLIGNLFTETSAPMGSRALDAADSLEVVLLEGDRVVSAGRTRGGVYRFADAATGLLRVAARFTPAIGETLFTGVADTSAAFTYDGGTLDLDEILELTPRGLLRNPPNPFPTAHGVGAEFTLAAAGPIDVDYFTLAGRRVWHFDFHRDAAVPAGFQHIHWMGRTSAGEALPLGPYWCCTRFDGGEAWNLVFKE